MVLHSPPLVEFTTMEPPRPVHAAWLMQVRLNARKKYPGKHAVQILKLEQLAQFTSQLDGIQVFSPELMNPSEHTHVNDSDVRSYGLRCHSVQVWSAPHVELAVQF